MSTERVLEMMAAAIADPSIESIANSLGVCVGHRINEMREAIGDSVFAVASDDGRWNVECLTERFQHLQSLEKLRNDEAALLRVAATLHAALKGK